MLFGQCSLVKRLMTDLALKAQSKAYVQNKAVMTEGEW